MPEVKSTGSRPVTTTPTTPAARPAGGTVAPKPLTFNDGFNAGAGATAQTEVEFKAETPGEKKQEAPEDFKAQMASQIASGGRPVRPRSAQPQDDAENRVETAVATSHFHTQDSRASDALDQAGRTAKGLKKGRDIATTLYGGKQLMEGIKEGDAGDIAKGTIKVASGTSSLAASHLSHAANKATEQAAAGGSAATAATAQSTAAKAALAKAGVKTAGGALGAVTYTANMVKTLNDPNLSATEKALYASADGVSAAFSATSAVEGGSKLLQKAAEKGTSATLTSVAAKSAKVAGTLSKVTPVLSKAFPAAATAMAAKDAYDVMKNPNSTTADKVMAGVHVATSAAGFVPGVGTAVAVGGELLYAGYNFFKGKLW